MNAICPSNLPDVIAAQQTAFIKNIEYDESIIQGTGDEAVAIIDGEEIPILSACWDIQIVQPGHIQNEPSYADKLGKILIRSSQESEPPIEILDEILLMPVNIIRHAWRYFLGNYGVDAKLVCYSNDGLRPSDKVLAPINPACAEITPGSGGMPRRKILCPKAQWQGDVKPECRASVTLGFYAPKLRMPLRLELHGTGYSAYNALQRSYNQVRNLARLKGKSINDYIVNLTTQNKGTYYLPVFSLQEAPEGIVPAKLLPICKHYMQTVLAPRIDEEPVTRAEGTAEAAVTVTEEDVDAVADAGEFQI